MTGIFGGVFDPPHVGHVELARTALDHFELERLLVLVVARPGHKPSETDPEIRLEMARAAFEGLPRTTVDLDEHAFTVDSLRARRPGDAIFLVGGDEYGDFASWKEPEEILRLVRLGVATRSGYDPTPIADDRVLHFQIDSPPVSSREIRDRIARGESVEGMVPPAVADLIDSHRLYRAD